MIFIFFTHTLRKHAQVQTIIHQTPIQTTIQSVVYAIYTIAQKLVSVSHRKFPVMPVFVCPERRHQFFSIHGFSNVALWFTQFAR